MQRFCLNLVVLFVCLMGTFATSSMVIAAESTADAAPGSFKAIYDSTIKTCIGHETEVAREADQAAKEKKYVEASAKYLAAATPLFSGGSFERARPNLDKAFLSATKISVGEQKEMLKTLSVLIGEGHNIHDRDATKYLAQQRLRLMQQQPGITVEDRYRDITRLAFSCSQHQRYKEAEALLLETLQDLQSIKPEPEDVGDCERILANVFGNAGDLENAQKYYELSTDFARKRHDRHDLIYVLEGYICFLVNHKLSKELVPIADEYFKLVTSPEQERRKDGVSFGLIARGLADIDVNEADKYYRAAFENEKEMTKSAMDAGYVRTICEWAEMLNKYGRTNDAISVLNEGMAFCRISVLNEGMAFCRSAKWPNALDIYMPKMAKKCEQILRSAGRINEANNVCATLEREMVAHKEKLAQVETRELEEAVNNTNVKPVKKVSAITEMAYRSFRASKCAEALNYLEKALKVYEENAKSDDNPSMYDCFYNISKQLTTCGDAQHSESILLRIVKARMVYGFSDQVADHGTACGNGPRPVDAFDDLFHYRWRQEPYQNQSQNQDALLNQLLEDAKASGKASTVVFLLTKQPQYWKLDAEKLALLEEIEWWRAKEKDSYMLIGSMMETAYMYMYLKQYDKMMDKLNAAIALHDKADESGRHPRSSYSLGLDNFANTLLANDRLNLAGDLYITGYSQSLRERGDYNPQVYLRDMEKLANKYRQTHDVSAGAALLETALNATRTELGEDGTQTRSCLMKLASYYILADEHGRAKETTQELIASVTKPGMSIAKSTSDDMAVLARLLKEHDYTTEAGKLEDRLKELEHQQCAPK